MSRINLEQANRIIAGALAHSASQDYKPMAIVVLDEAGHLKSAQRQDGAIIGSVGASGGSGDEDEVICIAGVQAAGLSHA